MVQTINEQNKEIRLLKKQRRDQARRCFVIYH